MESRGKTVNIILFILYVILSSSGLILFKLGSLNPNIHLHFFGLSLNISVKSIIGIICYGASLIPLFLLWMMIISRSNLTIAMPLSIALVNTLVIVGSCLFLKEKITIIQGIGIFIVIFGVCIMSWGRK